MKWIDVKPPIDTVIENDLALGYRPEIRDTKFLLYVDGRRAERFRLASSLMRLEPNQRQTSKGTIFPSSAFSFFRPHSQRQISLNPGSRSNEH